MNNLAFGYICNNVPIELLETFNIKPIRLFGKKGPVTTAENFLSVYGCSFIRAVLEEFISSNELDGVVTATSCDAMGVLGDLLRQIRTDIFYYNFACPINTDTPEAISFFRAEAKRFSDKLSAFTGQKFSVQQFRNAVFSYHDVHQAVNDLQNVSSKSGQDNMIPYYDLVNAGNQAGINDFAAMVNTFKNEQASNKKEAPANSGKKRIFLIGNSVYDQEVFSLIQDANLSIVGDLLCFSGRNFKRASNLESKINFSNCSQDELFDFLAEKYVRQFPCAARYGVTPESDWDNLIVEEIKNSHADGVIFLVVKYCDPHSFQHYRLKEPLEEAGIPSITIDIDFQGKFAHQILTRIEAFSEILAER